MATSRPTPRVRSSASPAAELGLPEDESLESPTEVTVELEAERRRSPELAKEEAEAEASLQLEENDDGSVSVVAPEEDEEDPLDELEFHDNLATKLDSNVLARVGRDLLDSITLDRKAREKRDRDYAEGLKRTGLDDSSGGATFKGASRAVHPVLMEGCIDFSARAMKELFPAKGPVKTHIVGKQTDEKLDKAERKRQYMNWQLTKQISEYRPELERLLTQLPLGGSQYLKFWRDDDAERARCEFVPIDDLLLPYSASDFYSTPRLTHVQHLTRAEFERRVASKMYRESSYASENAGQPEQTAAGVVSDRIEGREDPAYNEDGLRDVYEVQVYLDLEGADKKAREGRPAPYVVTIEDSTGYVLAVYRNWDEEDDKCQKLHWIVEWQMFPWRGAYALGLAQAIGGLASGATGALRALLDSAHIANFPAALKLKGSRVSSQSIELQATGLTDIEGPTAVDDIRKLVMPLPFPGPSAVLFELMKFCVDAAKGLISTADERIAEQNPNAPVGTTLALIEQGSITFSAVHARLHESQRRALEIVHRLNSEYTEDEETIEDLGELVVRRADFEGPMDVMPVSDPNIFSDSQRYAQQQAVLQLRAQFPGAFKDNELLIRTLKLLNYPDYEEVLNVPGAPEELDPVQENIHARDPLKQLKVYDTNDDLEHLKIHIPFMTSPLFCANPIMAIPALPALVKHCTEHLAALYRKNARAAIKSAQAVSLAQGAPGETDATSGIMLAEQELAREIGPLMDHLMQAAEMAKKFAPPPPMDPATAAAQAQIQIANIREQGAAAREQMKQQGEAMRQQAEDALKQTLAQATLNFDAQQSELQRAFEGFQAEMERRVNAHNVEVAEASERQSQQIQVLLSKIREDAAAARQQEQGALSLELENLRAFNKRVEMILADKLAPEGAGGEQPASTEKFESSKE